MATLYPLTFHPIFKERIWGGRKLADLYGKPLPADLPIGESWEISDRPGDVSVISNGPLTGKSLRWLMENHGSDVMGRDVPTGTRFPLLIKILDARDKLSLQVHPPAHKALELGGEPKTEMWHIVDADPGARLYAGLRQGVTRERFERDLADGTVEQCFHQVPVAAGDTMFLPSGRVHAIGAGLVIFEIQQNSDTTYRVFDWNRPGLDGKPRELHLQESLESIDFQDFTPPLEPRLAAGDLPVYTQTLVEDPLFEVQSCRLASDQALPMAKSRMQIVGVVAGSLTVTADGFEQILKPGGFCLVPACCAAAVKAGPAAKFLVTTLGA